MSHGNGYDKPHRSRGFLTSRAVVNALRVFWLVTILWCEIGIFSWNVGNCQWPDKDFNSQKSTHVLVVADPQVLDHRSYPGRHSLLMRLSQFIVDWNLRKSWRATMKFKPDAVIFLGDMMDGGRFAMSDREYDSYFRRFKSIFKTTPFVPVYYLPGNHDVSLGDDSSFAKLGRDRYLTHFGPLNQQFSIGGHTLVLIDAPSLVDEDRRRVELGMSYDQWTPGSGGTPEFVQYLRLDHHKNGNNILFSHIPLYRPEGSSCGPLREKGTIHRGAGLGYQNTLSESGTRFLLNRIRPALVLSGDDHDYCDHTHTIVPSDSSSSDQTAVREVTVKSFSMAMGVRRPGFQLLSLASPSRATYAYESVRSPRSTVADRPCLLPDQLGIYLSVYVPLIVLSLVVLLLFNIFRVQKPGSSETSPHRRRNSISDRDSDDMDDRDESYLLPTLGGPNDSHSRPDREIRGGSWTARVGGRRLILKAPSYLYSLMWKGCRAKRRRRGFIGGLMEDVADVAWPPLVLFVLVAAWMFR